jgi:hypothetical protein
VYERGKDLIGHIFIVYYCVCVRKQIVGAQSMRVCMNVCTDFVWLLLPHAHCTLSYGTKKIIQCNKLENRNAWGKLCSWIWVLGVSKAKSACRCWIMV